MDFFQNRYYRLNKFLLSCVGQWPLQSRKGRYFFRTTTVILVTSIIIPKFIALIEVLGDTFGMLECLPVLSLDLRSVMKFFNCMIKADTMKELTNKIWRDWTAKTADFEAALIKRYAARGRLISVLYAGYIYSVLQVYLLMPITPLLLDYFSPLNHSRDKVHLYPAQYYIDRDENYYYLLLHAYISMPVSLAVIVAYDAMFAVYVQHCCCIFAILGARLERIGKFDKERSKSADKHVGDKDETYDYIVNCIKIHKEAVSYARLLEASGTECYLFVILISILGITLTGYMMVKNLSDPIEASRFGIVVFGEILHMFYLCWQGHTLMEHSETVFISAYNVDWYDLSPPAKKLLILIMLRSLEPCKLTGGKIFVLSMASYASTLKTSMSYFTVLRSMQ